MDPDETAPELLSMDELLDLVDDDGQARPTMEDEIRRELAALI
jgi:hypothetical protein